MKRRDFFKIMGIASGAALTACKVNNADEKLLPYLVPPEEGIIPGIPRYARSTCMECPANCGLNIKIREDKPVQVPVADASFIAAFDIDGFLLGTAVPARIMGYQDTIRMLFGYDPGAEALTGFVVLESRETPGLGSKIGTDPAFLASLTGLDVQLVGNRLAHPVTLATWGQTREPWQVDGITGATVSANAVIQAINDAAPEFEAIRRHLAALRSTSKQEPSRD